MLRNGGRTSASGTYRGADNKSASYTLAMSYDNMHRIKSKSQHLTQQGVQFDGTLNAGYDLAYTYQDSLGHKFQLSKIEDLNYRTEEHPKRKSTTDTDTSTMPTQPCLHQYQPCQERR